MSPIIMYVEDFSASEAFPIVTLIILVCSSCTLYMGVVDKYENPNNPIIEYDYMIIFCPCIILGTKIGTILNKMLPNAILCIVLSVCVVLSFIKTYGNYQKNKQKEEESQMQLIDREQKKDTIQASILTNEQEPIRYDRIKFIFVLIAIMILDQILEGNSKLPSILGIEKYIQLIQM
jgi:uncharacterized membrane protein YfcA